MAPTKPSASTTTGAGTRAGTRARPVGASLGSQAYLPPDRLVDLVGWRRWYQSRRAGTRMAAWATTHPALLDWQQPVRHMDGGEAGPRSEFDFEAPLSSPRTDAMQGALVSLTQTGDPDAAVTLLVQLRPGLVRLVRQAGVGRSWSRVEAVAEVRSVFFEVLAGHSLERRPSSIAANLLLDTRQRLNRGQRSCQPPLTAVVPRSLPDVDAYTPVLAFETLRSAAGALPGSPSSRRLTTDLGFRAWVLDQPRSDIARELNLGPEGVRSRLYRFRSAIRSAYDSQDSHHEDGVAVDRPKAA